MENKMEIGQYVLQERIGQGTYGVVFKAVHKVSQQVFAIKVIKLGDSPSGVPYSAIREIGILKTLEHPNVVQLVEVVIDRKGACLVFEYVQYDLRTFVASKVKSGQTIKHWRIAEQLIRSVHFIHSHRILHRDLKPQNILVTAEGNIKIADFGLSRTLTVSPETLTYEIVTLWYRCPEVLLGQREYADTIDIWSIGTILFEIVATKPLFAGESEIDQLFKIFRILGTPNTQIWPGVDKLPYFQEKFPRWEPISLSKLLKELNNFCDDEYVQLIESMLCYDPGQRIALPKALVIVQSKLRQMDSN